VSAIVSPQSNRISISTPMTATTIMMHSVAMPTMIIMSLALSP
jgi:hypothetical protein